MTTPWYLAPKPLAAIKKMLASGPQVELLERRYTINIECDPTYRYIIPADLSALFEAVFMEALAPEKTSEDRFELLESSPDEIATALFGDRSYAETVVPEWAARREVIRANISAALAGERIAA